MMVIDFAKKIKKLLPKTIQLHSLKLQETETSFAEWFAHDND
jgi:6-pyruvoyltetrahydropterin/6-carboxytetrahydropterin synthase